MATKNGCSFYREGLSVWPFVVNHTVRFACYFPDVLTLTWSDRRQKYRYVTECRYSDLTLTYDCAEVFSLYEPNGWIDPIAPPVYNDAGDTMFTLYPYQAGDGRNYNMVVKVGISSFTSNYRI